MLSFFFPFINNDFYSDNSAFKRITSRIGFNISTDTEFRELK